MVTAALIWLACQHLAPDQCQTNGIWHSHHLQTIESVVGTAEFAAADNQVTRPLMWHLSAELTVLTHEG